MGSRISALRKSIADPSPEEFNRLSGVPIADRCAKVAA
jgi:hypothetical protein